MMTRPSGPRRFVGETLLIASHNAGKVREIADLLAPYVTRFPSAADHRIDEPEETGETFVDNAVLKARHCMQASGLPALADDSGLAVDALDGAPGILSARWAERQDGTRDFAWGMQRLTEALDARGLPRAPELRTARFVCALAIAWPDGHVESVEGEVRGQLVWPPTGTHGFGYDPIFRPLGHIGTFGEMDASAKHAISHRADAFRKLVAHCFAGG